MVVSEDEEPANDVNEHITIESTDKVRLAHACTLKNLLAPIIFKA